MSDPSMADRAAILEPLRRACGWYDDGGNGFDPFAYMDALEAKVQDVADVLTEYACHQSWRCLWPERYPWDPDCPCGLVGVLAGFGIKVEMLTWRVYTE